MRPTSPSEPPSAEALRVFVENVVRAGGPLEIEDLARTHPELGAHLVELERRWMSAVQGVRVADRLHAGGSPGPEPAAQESVPESDGGPGEPPPDDSGVAGPSASVLRRLGAAGTKRRYRPRGEIARGGMGAILEVWDEDLRRTLAMKVALSRASAGGGAGPTSSDSRLLNRFLEEAQITGQLDHPGIVPVHELGLDSAGRLYFTMRLVKGRDLKEVFELVHREAPREGDSREPIDGEWTRTRALGVMLKVCEAMAFAHEKGVIHRDLKPANVMVGRFGETYVMDWGLARVLGREDAHDLRLLQDAPMSVVRTDRADDRTPDSPLVTMDGDVLGTPCYMAPEQARGRLEAIGPHSDVYAAGAMLYHLLTKRMPYVRPGERLSTRVVLERLLDGPPEPIHSLDRKVPAELVAICEKAMAREGAQRYATMLEMAEDLRAFLEDRVVRAHRTGSWAEFKKWIARNRAAAVASTAAVALALSGLATTVLLQARSNRELQRAKSDVEEARDLAVANERATEAARDEARGTAARAQISEYAANIAAASASLRLADAADARRRLERCNPALRGWEWHQLGLASDPSLRNLGGGEARAESVAWNPTGDLVAAASEDGTLSVFRAVDGVLEHTIPTGGDLADVLAFTADGTRLATAGRDKAVHLWSVSDGSRAGSFVGHEGAVMDVVFAPDGTLAATAGSDKRVRLFDVATGRLVRVLEGHRSAVTTLAFGRGSALLASGSRDRSVRVWDTRSGEILRELGGSTYPIAFVAIDPSGTLVASGSQAAQEAFGESVSRGANSMHVWRIEDGSLESVFSGPRQALTAGGFSPDGRWLVAASMDSSVWLFDLRSGYDQVLLGHSGGVIDVAWSPDGARLASCDTAGAVKLWNSELRMGFPLRGHAGMLTSLDFAGGGAYLVSASTDYTLRTWSTETGLVEAVLRGHQAPVMHVAASADGERLASASLDGTVRVWDVASGTELARYEEFEVGQLRAMATVHGRAAFHPRGHELAIADGDGAIKVRDLADGAVLAEFPAPGGVSMAVVWSADGRRLAQATAELMQPAAQVRILDRASGEVLASLELAERVLDLAWSPDGEQLALAAESTVRLVSAADLAERQALEGHEQRVHALAFSPDGRRLASGSADDSIRIWDLGTGQSLLTLESSGGDVVDLAFHPDGSQLAVAASDWSAFLWSTTPAAAREVARDRELAARRELLPALDPLFERFADPAVVVERLRADPGLEAERLGTAARLARLVGADPRAADREHWRAVRTPGEPEQDLYLALWSARVAAAAEPDEDQNVRLLGGALYRLGRLEDAVRELERARDLRIGRARVETLAMLAMAYERSGRHEPAERTFLELAALMQVPTNLIRLENQALFQEAERVLRGESGAD